MKIKQYFSFESYNNNHSLRKVSFECFDNAFKIKNAFEIQSIRRKNKMKDL